MNRLSLRQKWASLGICFALTSSGRDVAIEASDHILTTEIIAEIKKFKTKIIDWLHNQHESQFKETLPSTEEIDIESDHKKSWLTTLSSEEITHYRFLLENSYRNPDHDRFHDDEMPQRFRESMHTFADMEKALENFIAKMKEEKSCEMKKNFSSSSTPFLTIETEEAAKTTVTNFINARETLPEYLAYEQARAQWKDLHNPEHFRIRNEALKTYTEACKKLPEWQSYFTALKKRDAIVRLGIMQ
jgi:hypothetical protein